MTASEVVLVCQTCKHQQTFPADDPTPTDDASAESRARTLGWRLWSGETITGRTASIVLCPACSGAGSDEVRDAIHGWDAVCDTCNLTLAEDWDVDGDEHDGPVTHDQAKEWVRDHQCEPEARTIKPQGTVAPEYLPPDPLGRPHRTLDVPC